MAKNSENYPGLLTK